MAPFKKVLIANRGDVALRVMRACHEMGIETVAVHSTADESAMHVRLAGEAICIGPPTSKDSYLNMANILSAADISGADAIHPGVGFLSENADFAEISEAQGYAWIGPKAEVIRTMGDKVVAKDAARKAGIPCVPGSDGAVTSLEEAQTVADEVGYPVLVKASAGGGGRGMKVAETAKDLESALSMASQEAKAAFGNDEVYLEKYLGRPRHIEIQVLGDKHGNCIHLGERDCSLQRRHQKLFEEAPSVVLDDKARAKIGEVTAKAAQSIGYDSVGTVEYLYEDGEFYFIEMNTRLQVEHPITEVVTGVDLVAEQIRVAAGEKLRFKQKDITFTGHAVECRINAENPESFMPSPGKITALHPPGGPGVRFDSQVYEGYTIPPYYDSLAAKLIVYGEDRATALNRLERALTEFVLEGVDSTMPIFQWLLDDPAFRAGDYDIRWLETFMEERKKALDS